MIQVQQRVIERLGITSYERKAGPSTGNLQRPAGLRLLQT
jgi:hypothetical protein